MTMDELLAHMLELARVEKEDAQRRVVMSLNALAGLEWIKVLAHCIRLVMYVLTFVCTLALGQYTARCGLVPRGDAVRGGRHTDRSAAAAAHLSQPVAAAYRPYDGCFPSSFCLCLCVHVYVYVFACVKCVCVLRTGDPRIGRFAMATLKRRRDAFVHSMCPTLRQA